MPGGVAWNGVEWAYGPELVCITSPDYPDDYPHNAECVYSVLVDELHTITVDFATEERYDNLTINGVEYSGDGMNYGPGNALTGNVTLNTGDTISFTSDSYASERGFKICSYQGVLPPPPECFDPDRHGSDPFYYRGTKSVTTDGHTCGLWTDPPRTGRDYGERYEFPFLRDAENYCRLNYRGRPWCYTTTPGVSWDWCDVPECMPAPPAPPAPPEPNDSPDFSSDFSSDDSSDFSSDFSLDDSSDEDGELACCVGDPDKWRSRREMLRARWTADLDSSSELPTPVEGSLIG